MGSTKFYLVLTIHQLGPNFDNAHCPLFLWPQKIQSFFFFGWKIQSKLYTLYIYTTW